MMASFRGARNARPTEQLAACSLAAVRIAYVGPVPPHRGGIAQHGQRTVESLRALGHAVEVVSWRAIYPRLLVKHQQPRITTDEQGRARFCLQWWNPLSWVAAGRSLQNADLIVVSWATPFHAVPLRMLLAAGRGTAAVAILHNPEPHEPMPCSRPLLKVLLRQMRGVVVHSEAVADRVRELTGVASIQVTPHPPNLNIGPAPLPPNPPLRLLMLGFVRRYKGVDLALDAVASGVARGLDLKLTIAGDFWEPAEPLFAELSARGLDDVVTLLPGYVPDDQVPELFAAHHLLLAPYRSATVSGLVPLAFSAGRPVVATPVGGLPEAVVDGVNGTVSAAVDAESLLNAIERAAADLDVLASNAADYAGDWADVADALLTAAGQDPASQS